MGGIDDGNGLETKAGGDFRGEVEGNGLRFVNLHGHESGLLKYFN